MSKHIRTISRPTGALQAGDVVLTHGSLFRITERNETTEEPRTPEAGPCVWCRTEYLGPWAPDAYEAIPRHWRADWIIQGNNLAHWAVVAE